jgi:hypothetical protein
VLPAAPLASPAEPPTSSPVTSDAAQAMLVAGSAVASLGGESLQTIDDADLKKLALDTIFVGSTAGDCYRCTPPTLLRCNTRWRSTANKNRTLI